MGETYNEVDSSLRLGTKKNKSETSESSESSSSRSSIEWPQSLQDFVNNSFIRANESLNDNQKEVFNQQLQELIEKAFNSNKIWENNWNLQRIPILDNVDELELECLKTRPTSPKISYKRLPGDDFNSNERKQQRIDRFSKDIPASITNSPSSNSSPIIIGKSEKLEKNYLRLTSEPNPLNVRPQNALEKSVKFVLDKYDKNKSYSYIINQFKSIRQDLTVQHIKNDFTIYVYETNAKISLENNDLGEFNQCQSQLKYLYYLKRKNDSTLTKRFFRLELEFLIYRIIYMIVMNNYSEIYKLKLSIKNIEDFEKTAKEIELFRLINILFKLNEEKLVGNFYNFFKIIEKFQSNRQLELGYKLIKNFLVDKEIIKSLLKISKSYRRISVAFLFELFKFKNFDEFKIFLKKYKLDEFLMNNNEEFDCINSRNKLANIINQTNFKKIDIKGQI